MAFCCAVHFHFGAFIPSPPSPPSTQVDSLAEAFLGSLDGAALGVESSLTSTGIASREGTKVHGVVCPCQFAVVLSPVLTSIVDEDALGATLGIPHARCEHRPSPSSNSRIWLWTGPRRPQSSYWPYSEMPLPLIWRPVAKRDVPERSEWCP